MAKKESRVVTYLNAGIFERECLFICGYTVDQALAWLKRKKHFHYYMGLDQDDIRKMMNGDLLGLYFCQTVNMKGTKKTGEYHYILLKKPFTKTSEDYITLAHECLHFCQQILPDILDRNVEYEAEAHLHSHLMQQCLKALE